MFLVQVNGADQLLKVPSSENVAQLKKLHGESNVLAVERDPAYRGHYFQVIHEYRAWQSFDKVLLDTTIMQEAVDYFVKQDSKDCSVIKMDGPSLALVLTNHRGKRLGRFIGSSSPATVETVLAGVKEVINGKTEVKAPEAVVTPSVELFTYRLTWRLDDEESFVTDSLEVQADSISGLTDTIQAIEKDHTIISIQNFNLS